MRPSRSITTGLFCAFLLATLAGSPRSSAATGFRRVIRPGNVANGTSWTLTAPPRGFYWSVQAGSHRVMWNGDGDGRDVASGVYLCRLSAGGVDDTRRMTLVR